MLKSKRFWAWSGAGLIALVLVWTGWQVWQVNRDLNDAVRHAEAIQVAVEARDTDTLDREVDGLRQASAAAADRTSGLTWSVLTKLPGFGDDAEGIEVTSRVLDGLARDGVQPLVSASERIDDLLPRDGAIDVGVVRELAEPVAAARAAFATADAELSAIDADGFVGRLQGRFTDFRDQVGRADRVMGTAETATQLLPAMLGDGERRNYLLGFQNNAELRSLGGLTGAVAYIRAEDGRLGITRHVTGGSFPQQPRPILPLTEAEQAVYGEVLGTYFVNATMSPDVPRAAELMRAHSAARFPQEPLDGVILVDTVAMAYLLEATGPVSAGGVEITSENAVDELLHNVYLRLEPAEQDEFFAEVARAVFDKVTGGIESPTDLFAALSRAAGEHRLFVHAFDEAEQAELAGSPISGEFSVDPDLRRPQIAVTIDDTTGSKMSYFLRHDLNVQATSCADGVQSFTATARLRSAAPPDAAQLPVSVTGSGVYAVDRGNELVTVRIYGPVGGRLDGLQLNSAPLEMDEFEWEGRPVGVTYLMLTPGQTLNLSWKMESGKDQPETADLQLTPTVEGVDPTTSVKSACR